MTQHKIIVTLTDGTQLEFMTTNEHSAREYAGAIIRSGYRYYHGDGVVEWYPPHRIHKVSVDNMTRGFRAVDSGPGPDGSGGWRA